MAGKKYLHKNKNSHFGRKKSQNLAALSIKAKFVYIRYVFYSLSNKQPNFGKHFEGKLPRCLETVKNNF